MNSGRTIVIVIVLVIIALIGFSFFAFYRDDSVAVPTPTPDVQEEDRNEPVIDMDPVRARAQSRLSALRTELLAEQGYEAAERQVVEIRAELAQAYRDASVELRPEWEAFDGQLEILEQQLRDESADALSTLERLIDRLREDVATDDEK